MSAREGQVPAAACAAYPRRRGNAVRVWIDGAAAFARIADAVESARHGVWLTLAFLEREAAWPGGRGTLFDLLERAAARGVDVRALCWREPRLASLEPGARHFGGDAADLAFLRGRAGGIRARWDRLPDGFAHHQKCWLVDAGEASERAFVGGLDPTAAAMAEPGYPAREAGNLHGAFLELAGPAASDVHHNFAQRWNEAADAGAPGGCWPDARAADPLPFPSFLSPARGEVPVQITRTVRPGTYREESPPPGAKPFAVAEGEQSVLEQYVSAVAAAERTVYVENRAIASPILVDELRRALVRGVRVVYLVPGEAHHAFVAARRERRAAAFFEQLAELGEHEHFTLAGLCASRDAGRYDEVGVHTNAAVVDDAWATVGSANAAVRSFRHDTELNASFWHPGEARALRRALFANALGEAAAAAETDAADEVHAFDRYRQVALANLDRRALWQPLEGRVYAIDPAQYGA